MANSRPKIIAGEEFHHQPPHHIHKIDLFLIRLITLLYSKHVKPWSWLTYLHIYLHDDDIFAVDHLVLKAAKLVLSSSAANCVKKYSQSVWSEWSSP